MSRLAPLAPERMSAEQHAIHARISAGPRGRVAGPFVAWMYSPCVARHVDELGTYLRFETGLPARLVELTILQTIAFWRSRFAWNRHVALARDLHISERILDALRYGTVPDHHDMLERAAYDFVDALLHKRATSDLDWQRLVTAFGETGEVDLVAIVGYYGFVAMTLAADAADREEPDPFGAIDRS